MRLKQLAHFLCLMLALILICLTVPAIATTISDIPESNASQSSWTEWSSIPDSGEKLEIHYCKVRSAGAFLVSWEVRNVSDSQLSFVLVFETDGEEHEDSLTRNLDSQVFRKTSGVISSTVTRSVTVKVRHLKIT